MRPQRQCHLMSNGVCRRRPRGLTQAFSARRSLKTEQWKNKSSTLSTPPARGRPRGRGARARASGQHTLTAAESSRPRVRRPRHGFSLPAKPRTGHAGQKGGGLTFHAAESHGLQNRNEAEAPPGWPHQEGVWEAVPAWRNGPSACDTGGGREKGPESRGLLPEVWFQDKSICWWMETHRGHGVTSRGRCETKLYCAFGSSRGLGNDEPHRQ